jgi:hypothetical protein
LSFNFALDNRKTGVVLVRIMKSSRLRNKLRQIVLVRNTTASKVLLKRVRMYLQNLVGSAGSYVQDQIIFSIWRGVQDVTCKTGLSGYLSYFFRRAVRFNVRIEVKFISPSKLHFPSRSF